MTCIRMGPFYRNNRVFLRSEALLKGMLLKKPGPFCLHIHFYDTQYVCHHANLIYIRMKVLHNSSKKLHISYH